MAKYVDKQNSLIKSYIKLVDQNQGSYAFQAACELVFQGCNRANGYTEEVLHKYRILEKNQKNLKNK
jgi:malate synthase